MDCDHATSIADVSGTLNGELISGLKETAYCALEGHTAKVQPAQHRRDIWQDEGSRQVKARPRFQPPMEVLNPRKGRFPTRPAAWLQNGHSQSKEVKAKEHLIWMKGGVWCQYMG
ncbi:unnamed protein product [Effrenium voratum]|nr:unnamed protein product [Effrenium voratum]